MKLRIIDGDNCLFDSKMKQVTEIECPYYPGVRDPLRIQEANHTSIHTNDKEIDFYVLDIRSRLLEINDAKIWVYHSFNYNGDILK